MSATLPQRLRGVIQRRVLAWTQPRFLVGVVALLRAPDGRILLLENRFWQGVRWGCPAGLMKHGEMPPDTVRRECAEECGVTPRDVRIARVVRGAPRTVEIWCTGTVDITEAPQRLQRLEITGAALLEPAEALAQMRPSHAEVVRALLTP